MVGPLVSILIGNHNYGRFLHEAIDSALAQTYPNIEVVVVDDGSTDDSRAVMQGYGDRITSVYKTNGGQGSAFNAGLTASHGEVICFLDADDLFHPAKVQTVLDGFARHPEVGWVIHNYRKFFPDGHDEAVRHYRQEEVIDDTARTRRGEYGVYCPPTSGLTFRRTLLATFFPVPEAIRITTDNYLKHQSALVSPVLLLPQVLMSQRVHGANLYTNLPARELERKRYEVNWGIGLSLMEQAPSRPLGLTTMAGGLTSGVTSGALSVPGAMARIMQLPYLSGRQRWSLTVRLLRGWLRPGAKLRALLKRLQPTPSSGQRAG